MGVTHHTKCEKEQAMPSAVKSLPAVMLALSLASNSKNMFLLLNYKYRKSMKAEVKQQFLSKGRHRSHCVEQCLEVSWRPHKPQRNVSVHKRSCKRRTQSHKRSCKKTRESQQENKTSPQERPTGKTRKELRRNIPQHQEEQLCVSSTSRYNITLPRKEFGRTTR